MPVLATMDVIRASDLVLSEDQNARYSRDDVKIKAGGTAVQVGHLLKESATAGEYEAITAAAGLADAKYIAIYNADELHGNEMAVIARHAQIRPKFIRWPSAATLVQKAETAALFAAAGVIFRD